jgi:glyoxylase-like metal-dependent hydrolase (beta-lactamase superfamily II)
MKLISTVFSDASIVSMDGDLFLHQFVRESTGCASYLIASRGTRKCILIDPLTDTDRYLSFLQGHDLEVVLLLDTHTHADHLSGLRSFSKLFPRAARAMHETAPAGFVNTKLRDGEQVQSFIDLQGTIRVIYTPGHATDHICLIVESSGGHKLISGDCLFIGDVGRTDLGRGDNDQMYDSLFNKLLTLPPETEVYPAHVGAKHFLANTKVSTTIAAEKETNPALQIRSKPDFFKYMAEGWPPKPSHYQDIIEINIGRKPMSEAPDELLRA